MVMIRQTLQRLAALARGTAPVAEQTVGAVALQREVGDNLTSGMTPQRLADILDRARQGDIVDQAQAADLISEAPHLHCELSKRVTAVTAADWTVQPPEDPTPAESRLTEICADWCASNDMDDLLREMMSGVLHGWAMLETYWPDVGGLRLPVRPKLRPHTWFCAAPERRDILRLRSTGASHGVELRPYNWLQHYHKSRTGYPAETGLIRVVAWPWLIGSLPLRDWAEFLEIYGIPLRLGKYGPNATPADQAALRRAVQALGHSAAGIMPASMQIEVIEVATASAEPFEGLIRWAEGAISKAVLGGTMTTTAANTGLGSTQADVQDGVRREIMISDQREISKTIERQLFGAISALNFGAQNLRVPRLVWDNGDYEELTSFADAIGKLVDVGVDIPEEWARERLNIPDATAGARLLARKEPAAPPVQQITGLTRIPAAGNVASLAATINDPTPALAQQLGDNARAPLQAWIDQIRGWADETAANGGSLADLQARIIAGYGEMDRREMIAVMAVAMQTAAAAGLVDVVDETGEQ